MKCNFPRLSSGGENESSTRTTKWKQEAPRAPDSLSSTRCTMTSSGSELRMCKASAGTKDRTSSGILEEFFYLDRSLSLATAVRVCSLKYLLVRNRRVCDTHVPLTYCHATNKSSSGDAGFYYGDIWRELVLKHTERKVFSTDQRGTNGSETRPVEIFRSAHGR